MGSTAGPDAAWADAVADCRQGGATGWELAARATRLVHDRFTTYSVLHPWESPGTAFAHGRGFCTQYNGALAVLLRRLGFDAWLVYAARVHFDDGTEGALGHTWVRVRRDGEVRDVCARSAGNRPGAVGFTTHGRVRRLGPVTRVLTNLGTAALACSAVLLARARGRPRPSWVEHPRVSGSCG
jgi:transglutaminase-like putative cysteine protease